MAPLPIWEKSMETKHEIRNWIKEVRSQILPEEKALWDNKLQTRLFAEKEMEHPFCVFCYISTGTEAGTRLMIETLWQRGIQTAVPKVNGSKMDFFFIQNWEETSPGPMGILEPVSKKLEDEGQRPAVVQTGAVFLVPGLAFDKAGSRLGYGGGYYDRFFDRIRNIQCTKIGISYDFQIVKTVPRECHDYLLDKIVTPTQTIVCGRDKR